MSSSLDSFKQKAEKSLLALAKEFQNIRGGRPSASLLDKIQINAYGSQSPLKQNATISVQDSKTIIIKPFDSSLSQEIEKSITKSDLGLNPMNDGKSIKLIFPPLSDERRAQIVKNAKSIAEDIKVAIRNIRRDTLEEIKKQKKESLISEDEEKKINTEIQKLVDKYNKLVDEEFVKKEKEINKD